MKIEIKSRWNARVLFSLECESLKLCVEAAVKNSAGLRCADLRGADLSGADLRGAHLRCADLSCADLSCADLRGADLSGADLRGAHLRGADLRGADLRGAHLRGADLRGADLRGADLSGAITQPASPEEIARLDAVREIVLSKPQRLDMSLWHSDSWNPDHTPEEEHECKSAHCIAGWLQALSPDKQMRATSALDAGRKLAPASSYMFFVSDEIALEWLKERRYAKEATNV